MRSGSVLVVFAGALVLGTACASTPAQRSLPPQTMAPPAPAIEEPVSTAPQELPPESIASEPTDRGETATASGTEGAGEPVEEAPDGEQAEGEAEAEAEGITVVIEPATGVEQEPDSLYGAAQAEQRRREEVGESSIVINDKNLQDYAAQGQLTFVEEAEEGEEGEGGSEASGESEDRLAEMAAEETYWRERVGEIRRSWREEIDRIAELEEEVAALRHDFYAEDDPFYRDSQIKPAWDQALEDLEESRRAATEYQEELDRALEEGRRAGALPGWLREGLELEPTEEELEAIEEAGDDEFHRPSEPIILDEDGSGS